MAAVPYYPLIAPQVPVADNTAAKIISEGTGNIVQTLTAAARLRQQQDLETRKMAFDAATDAQKFGLEKEKQAQDFVISQKHNEIMGEYYGSLGAAAIMNAEARKTSSTSAAFRQAEENKKRAEFDTQLAAFQANADARAKELRLDDPDFQTKNPIEVAANLQKFKGEYGQALAYTGIPQRIAHWQTMLDQQKFPFKEGATYDPFSDKWVGGALTRVPAWQLAQKYGEADDDGKAAIAGGLMAAGMGHITQTLQKIAGKNVPENTEELNPKVAGYLKKGETTDFGRGTNQVPESLTRPYRRGVNPDANDSPPAADPGATSTPSGQLRDQSAIDQAKEAMDYESSIPVEPAALPGTSSAAPAARTPSFDPTQTDTYLQHARNALDAGAPRDAIAQRLQGLGIDPSLLDEAA